MKNTLSPVRIALATAVFLVLVVGGAAAIARTGLLDPAQELTNGAVMTTIAPITTTTALEPLTEEPVAQELYECTDGTRSNTPCEERGTATTALPTCPSPYTYDPSDGLCHNLVLDQALDDLAAAQQEGRDMCGEHYTQRMNLIEDGLDIGYYAGDAGKVAFSIDMAKAQSALDECLDGLR